MRGFLCLLLAIHGQWLLAYTDQESDYIRVFDPALGISSSFGRWDGPVNLIYDPDGAPALFADTEVVLALLEQAADEWELVSGIQINVTGADSNALEDENESNPNARDGLVRVNWTDTGGAQGRGGPGGSFFSFSKGYFPYEDGNLELNDNPESWNSERELVRVLVHELGHVLGLGHSDNPDSVMYANPYNFLSHPRADDILAVRTLYGEGPVVIDDVTQPLAQWLFSAPPAAPAGDTTALFKANGIFDQGPFIGLGSDEALTVIDDTVPDNSFAYFYFPVGPSFAGTEIDTTIVFVDPQGYVYDEREYSISCDPNFSCGSGLSIGTGNVLRSIPGDWMIYVVDAASQLTLFEFPFTVEGGIQYNQPPTAEVTVTGIGGRSVNIRLDVTDSDSGSVEVTWYVPENAEASETVQSGQSLDGGFSFPLFGSYTLYAQLDDDGARYDGSNSGSSNAGSGFQTLISITVDLPVESDADVSVVSTFLAGEGGEVDRQQVIDTIAGSRSLELVTTSDNTSTTARFGAGATADDGLSTALGFASGTSITIAGSVEPQSTDVGQAGEIFVVLYTDTSLSTLDLDGNYSAWNGSLKTIQPAFELTTLASLQNFEVFSGAVQSGRYRVFLGYRLAAGGPIHFNAKAFRVDVD